MTLKMTATVSGIYSPIVSRFATSEEIFSAPFANINKELIDLQKKYDLLDQSDLNAKRFKWIDRIDSRPMYYASRMWEYPFAILSANLTKGMSVADIGCGNTPFTAYLASLLGGDNVYGYDPDVVNDNDDGHSHFGARLSYLQQLGVNFFRDSVSNLSAADGAFDVVFCISVLEHIDNPWEKSYGIKEMARIVKPGGKLILTFDLGINLPLNHLWDVISSSGLTPIGLDATWPKRRFVNYGEGSSVDVFGLVLQKPVDYIYVDCNSDTLVDSTLANKKYQDKTIFYSLTYSQVLAAHDLASKYGSLKVFVKNILGRY